MDLFTLVVIISASIAGTFGEFCMNYFAWLAEAA